MGALFRALAAKNSVFINPRSSGNGDSVLLAVENGVPTPLHEGMTLNPGSIRTTWSAAMRPCGESRILSWEAETHATKP